MKCIDPLVTGYERGTFEERSARTESSPRQSGKKSEDDSRANNNICETLGILSAKLGTSPGTSGNIGIASFTGSTKHMQGIDAQIRAQYSQGSAFLPRDVRILSRISLPNILLAAPATHNAWLKQVCAAREC
jgi:hypothetical protein